MNKTKTKQELINEIRTNLKLLAQTNSLDSCKQLINDGKEEQYIIVCSKMPSELKQFNQFEIH